MTYEEALAYIHSLPRFPDLGPMRALMRMLENPQDELKTVHIAGTNGKGSTAAMTASILRAAGYKTGLYISPYIIDFRERIQIDGEMIPKEALAALTEELRPLSERAGGLTEFAFVTALAFLWFLRQKCEICVIEVGLGGRLDATNVLKKPMLSVITKIGMDHTALLGDTVEAIAREKCGIIKPGVRTVTCGGQDPDALAVIYEEAMLHGDGTVVQPNRSAVEGLYMEISGSDFIYNGYQIHLPLPGAYQIDNALTAITVVDELSRFSGFKGAGRFVGPGLVSVRFPARMERMRSEPPVLLDGAHNPQGAAALAQSLSLLGSRPITAVMGMLADKDSSGALEILLPHFRRLICVTPENSRALSGAELSQRAAALGAHATSCESLPAALKQAIAQARAEGGAAVVCGSLYLASAARPYLLENSGD